MTTNLAPLPSSRLGRFTVTVLIVLVAAVAATLVIVANSATDSESARISSAETQEQAQIAGCRSVYRSDIDDASARLDVLIATGLPAAVAEDEAALNAVLAEFPAAVDALNTANDEYRAAIIRSLQDPDEFLRECEELQR